jgi:murein DD-endopeptidase MepM/ murein hydrolase activator NlpD
VESPPVALAANVTVMPRDGEGWISLVSRTCGTAKSWPAIAAGRKLYAGRTVTVDCKATATPTTSAPAKAPSWVNPVPGKCITSGFGWRGGRIHQGVDIGAAVGTDVRAAAAGVVHWGNEPGGAGWYIQMDHGGGVWTSYFHLSNRKVADGKWVAAGTVIADSGGARGAPGAGNSSGPHAHFEVRPWGRYVKHWNAALGAYAYASPVTWMAQHGSKVGC